MEIKCSKAISRAVVCCCVRLSKSGWKSKPLAGIREPVWSYVRERCSSFQARDCDASFRHIRSELHTICIFICKGKLGIARRKTDVVVRTHPNYSSNPKGPSYGLFCKYQLLKYKPWLHSFDSAWDHQDNSDVVYIEKWAEF